MVKKWWPDVVPIGFLSLVWLIAAFLVNPIGDFPLNDDFSYGRSVYHLVEQGQYKLDDWLSMTLLTQVFWGAAFCEPFGFSFTALRISTLVLAWLGLIGVYFLVKEIGRDNRSALLASLTIAFNPIFFSLSFTFMTDVPFLACTVLSSLFLVKTLRSETLWHLTLGVAFGLAAVFVRQHGLLLPAAFAVGWLVKKGVSWKPLLTASIPAVLSVGLFLAYTGWLEQRQGLTEGYGDFGRILEMFDLGKISGAPLRIGLMLSYLGAMLLPVLLVGHGKLVHKNLLRHSFLEWILMVFSCFTIIQSLPRLPWGNIFYDLGLGPKLLKDGYYFINVAPRLQGWGSVGLKIGAALSGLLLVGRLLQQWPKKHGSPSLPSPLASFSLTAIVLYLGFLLVDLHFFDRYLLVLLPFSLLLLLSKHRGEATGRNRVSLWPIIIVCLMAAFSVLATHDYLAWNRARWEALHYLTVGKGVPPNKIDGGFEFNGWHKPGPRGERDYKSWWWVDEQAFVVAFGDLPSFSKEMAFPYQRWLPPGRDSVFVLKEIKQ